MPQSPQQQTVNTFVGGLVTEATPLTQPENTSVDEDNCDLLTDGSRRRRKGIKIQTGNTLSTFTINEGDLIHTETWNDVAEEAGLSFLVVQRKRTLHFYQKLAYPVSSFKHAFTYNLTPHKVSSSSFSIDANPIQTTVVNGDLVVVNPGMDAIIIKYNPTSDTFTVSELPVPKIRDFEWQGDTSGYFQDQPTSTTNDNRKYDTYNAGWTSDVLAQYLTFGVYPRLTHPWWTASDLPSGEQFDEDNWQKQTEFGNTLTSNGHLVINLFTKDRRGALQSDQGVTLNIASDPVNSRFSSVSNYAGRVWFSGLGDSKVYFSKTVENDEDITKFYQVQDPTAKDFNDLLDTDGGVISIPEANYIRKMYTYGSSLIVFADNGIWEIGGPDNIFKATEFSVTKLSNIGLTNFNTFVDAEGTPFWWGKFGVHTLTRDNVSLNAQVQDLSKSSIQTFFDGISVLSKVNARGVYDAHNKIITWMFSTDVSNPKKMNRMLHLHIPLRAFYPWTITDKEVQTPYVIGAAFFEGYGFGQEQVSVVSDGNNVVENTVQVTATIQSLVSDTEPRVVYLVFDYDGGGAGRLSFADTSQISFGDWDTDEEYSSYVEAAYNFMGGLTLEKRGLVISTYMKQTETGWQASGNGYTPVQPSSLKMKAFWDLRNSSVSTQELYRLRANPVVDPAVLNSFDYPYEAIATKTKVRGRGRVLKLRFESSGTNDFHLFGYEFIGLVNQGL